jgi:hypothetical protein
MIGARCIPRQLRDRQDRAYRLGGLARPTDRLGALWGAGHVRLCGHAVQSPHSQEHHARRTLVNNEFDDYEEQV